jgi:hypothetical protein
MAHGDFNLRVEAGAGRGGQAIPRRFYLGSRPVVVDEVLDRWLGDDRSYYKVRGDDGDVYILLHEWAPERAQEHWELTLFTSGSLAATVSC